MTDKSITSQHAENQTTEKSVIKSSAKVTKERQPSSKAGVIIGVIAIIFLLILTVGLFYHGHQRSIIHQLAITKLQSQQQAQQDSQQSFSLQLNESQQRVTTQLQQTTLQLSVMKNNEQLAAAKIETVQLAIANLKMRNPNEWMLAEAEYLIRIAGRKLALEQDVDSSLALLASAGRRITELNDPSLLPLRKVIEQDIATLAKLPRIDRDGVALKLSVQAKDVSNLPLAGFARPESNQAEEALSSDASDWKENLRKTWHSFSENFITVRRHDSAVEALLSPKEAWYLTENLKTKLLQAELAVYRQNQAAFTNSVTTSIEWINSYYDTSRRETQAMLEILNGLRDTVITAEYPSKLQSAPRIQTTIRDRKIKKLTTNSIAQ
ncbi:MAG: uroporphyrin-3 C-methyltransferase [Moritella sp.]|jgi:uroporphyrin-3 C-methyltransferase